MNPYDPFKIAEENGLFCMFLPPFDDDWKKIVPADGYVWVNSLRGMEIHDDVHSMIASHLAKSVFKTDDLDLQCSLHHLWYDFSIPCNDLLRFVEQRLFEPVDLIFSDKHQPPGFQLNRISKFLWPQMLQQNQIKFLFFASFWGQDPTLLQSTRREMLEEIANRFQQDV